MGRGRAAVCGPAVRVRHALNSPGRALPTRSARASPGRALLTRSARVPAPDPAPDPRRRSPALGWRPRARRELLLNRRLGGIRHGRPALAHIAADTLASANDIGNGTAHERSHVFFRRDLDFVHCMLHVVGQTGTIVSPVCALLTRSTIVAPRSHHRAHRRHQQIVYKPRRKRSPRQRARSRTSAARGVGLQRDITTITGTEGNGKEEQSETDVLYVSVRSGWTEENS